MVRLLLLLTVVLEMACSSSTAVQVAERVTRAPLEKSSIVLKAPTEYERRVSHIDPKTNQPVYYDPKPQVKLIDAKAGKYAFKWTGYDGKEKVVEYQRYDAIDAIVSATVSRTSSGQYLYTYKIENLASSGQHLSGFMVQNFAADLKALNLDGVFVGEMSKSILQFSKGNWKSFGILPEFNPAVVPGRNIELQLASSAPPGLVACRIRGGVLGLKGAGEHMPSELEAVMSGYDALPHGHTIGPVDKLTSLPRAERATYILDLLPQLQELGWITSDARRRYEEQLKGGDMEAMHERLEQDLKAEQITTEVFAMIQAMK